MSEKCKCEIVTSGTQPIVWKLEDLVIKYCPEHNAADAMYDLLCSDVLPYFESEWDALDRHPASRFGDWVKIIKATLNLAKPCGR